MSTALLDLPVEARQVEPCLADIGSDLPFQRLVFAQFEPGVHRAVIVAELTARHPFGEGKVGSYYGTRVRGMKLGDTFKAWGSENLGEMWWDPSAKKWKVCS